MVANDGRLSDNSHDNSSGDYANEFPTGQKGQTEDESSEELRMIYIIF